MWKPILEKHICEPKIHEIAEIVSDSSLWKRSPGLFNGMAGTALFLAYYDKFCDSSYHQPVIEELVSRIFEKVESNWPTSCFCTGLSGILWSVKHLASMNCIDADTDFNYLNEVLIREMKQHADNGFFDFLHGSNGIFYYLVLNTDSICRHLQEALFTQIEQLTEKSLREARGTYWESYIHPRNPKKVANLSLSHGISSTIVILSLFVKKNPGHNQSEKLLQGTINYLLNCKNPTTKEYYSLYPGTISPEEIHNNSRLGWCYGDISHAIALNAVGKLLDNRSCQQEASRIMQHAARRRNLERDFIRDAGLCHGASGIAHIFNRFYQATSDPQQLDAARFWYKQTLQMSNQTDGLAGYKMFHGEKGWQNEVDLLEGIAGIGLALLGAVDNTVPRWDEAFLISSPN